MHRVALRRTSQRLGVASGITTAMRFAATKQFTASHEWVAVEGTNATVGITHHAQEALGDIVFVGLPAVGAVFNAKETAADIESVKATSDIYSPVSGTVSSVNEKLKNSPELVNAHAEGDAWLFKLSNVKLPLPDGLMTKAQYDEFLTKESH